MKKLWLLLLCLSAASVGLASVDHRLLISAGILDDHNPLADFYESKIFVADTEPPFVISQAQVSAYSYKNSFFYGENLNPSDIIAAQSQNKKPECPGLTGHSYYGVVLNDKLISQELSRYLGTASTSYKRVSQTHQGKVVWAFSAKESNLAWPSDPSQLVKIPAVVIKDNSGAELLVVARPVGSVAAKLGMVDSLLLRKTPVNYIDIGSNTGRPIKAKLLKAFAQRNPRAALLGTHQMSTLIQDSAALAELPACYPLGEHNHLALGDSIKLWSLTNDEKLWSLYRGLGAPKNIDQGIAAMAKQQASPEKTLNIVRVFSEQAAFKAAKSVYVDVVLLLSHTPYAQLPRREVIELKHAETDSYEQIAPIIGVSPLDISEVVLSGAKIEVIRHALDEHSPQAQDIAPDSLASENQANLPSMVELYGADRLWRQRDFNLVLAGFIRQSTGADVVIFEDDKDSTPINGPMSHDLAMARLDKPGVISLISTNGRQLKKIARQIASGNFSKKLAIFGVDPKGRLVRDRLLNDNEHFTLAVSEEALLEIFGLSLTGGLSDEVTLRAPFVEQIYGKMESLFFIGGQKTIARDETARSLEHALSTVRANKSIKSVVKEELGRTQVLALKQFIDAPAGAAQHALTLNIDYLDFGFSQNVANQTYKNYQDSKDIRLPMSRGGVDLYTHLILFSKLSLVYDAPGLISTLNNSTRYMTVSGFNEKPTRDKTTFGLDFRLPWERTLFKDKSIVLSPIFKNLYETKLGPFFFAANSDEAWRKLKVLPRTNRLDSLLGINTNFTNLGFDFDLGAMMAADFNRVSTNDALDFGPGFNFLSKWNLWGPLELSSTMLGYYLFPLPNNKAKDKVALGIEGTVWLRVARFHDFGLSLMSDFLIASLQEKPKEFAMSSIFGVTLSYGRLFRLFG